MSTASERIKEGMALRGLKQVDLVERTGISKGALSSYISGRYIPKQNNTFLIAKALDVNEAWLMGADVPMERVSGKTESKQGPSYSSQCKEIIEVCEQLSAHNQRKVLTYSKNLLSTQQMEDALLPNAAHEMNPTEEQKKHADDVMKDDKEWI